AGAMLFKSGGVASRFFYLVRETGGGTRSRTELGSGMSAEMLAGFAGVALGILALVGLVPMTLCTVAVIAFGGALLLGGGETYRVSHLGRYPEDTAEYAARLSAESAAGGETLVGIAAIVLGILALIGFQPALLTLIGLLCLGGGMLLSGMAVSVRMLLAMQR
ncbi:MAG TPA: hypothetical protein VHE81_15220, partial [Lacipirellulaceae bacterium]|nr:hypothetical protein [Lacipirellulaceae bacterium]